MKILDNYNKWLNLTSKEEMDSVNQSSLIDDCMSDLNDCDYKTVLCVGAGDGTEVKKFKELSKEVTGTSMFPIDGLDIEDICGMTYQDKSFDLVFAKDVFEHAVSPIMAMSELVRVAKKYVYIAMPKDEEWSEGQYHFVIPTKKGMINLAKKCGAKGIKTIDRYKFDRYLIFI